MTSNSRIGLWSAYLDLSLGDWRAELTWMPDLDEPRHSRAGAWFELTAPRFRFGAPLAWRAELSHQPSRWFNLRDEAGLRAEELQQTTLGIGADVVLPGNLLANLQFIWDRVHDAPSTLVRPDEDQLITLFLRRGFAYETLQTEVRWYHSLSDHDDTLVATLRYELSDDTRAYISSEWFSGSADGLFGQFAERDRVVIGITRYF
jgi:hypothetical protein